MADESGWTISTLKEHYDEIMAIERAHAAEIRTADRLAVVTAMAAADRANEKSERSDERRFESVNEFRQSLADQTATFITRREAIAAIVAIVAIITAVVAVVR